MNFLKKLFGRKPDEKKRDPENTQLIYLLNIWGEHQSTENYQAVVKEILEGNSFLLLPSENDNSGPRTWKTLDVGATLKLKSVFNVDGLQVLGAFSDEHALLEWFKGETGYTAMKTQDLIEFCKQNGIDRIVINSDQKNMLVLERNRENIKTNIIQEETKVLVGAPSKPLNQQVLNKLIDNFRKVNTIEEAYQYAQSMGNETSIVLGIKMSVRSDDARAALHNAINNSLHDVELEMPLDIMLLDEDWLETVKGIENSLFYKR